jgi:hypothetical protein
LIIIRATTIIITGIIIERVIYAQQEEGHC